MKNILLIAISLVISLSGVAQLWQQVAINTTLKLNSISFGSEQVGYIGANDSTLFKTFDGGETWAVFPTQGIQFSPSLPHITQVDFLTADTGYLMLGTTPYGGAYYKTVDGGSSWVLDTTSMCAPVFAYNFDSQNSFVVGSSCFGGKTIDVKENGAWTWNTTYLSWGPEYLHTIDFYDSNFGIAAGDSGQFHRTLDAGATWDTINTITDKIIWDVQFVNDSVIYAVVDSSSNSLMISIDSGLTWDFHHNSLTFFYPQLEALQEMRGESVIAVGAASLPNTGIILWGSEHSTFWRVESTPQSLNNVGAKNDSIAFVVGDSGLIMTNTDIIHSIGPVPEKSEVSVYPNPSSDRISIQTADTVVKVMVMDVVGKVVFESDQVLEISVADVFPGMYYVVVTTTKGRSVVPLVVQ